jgi:hypothetical protein
MMLALQRDRISSMGASTNTPTGRIEGESNILSSFAFSKDTCLLLGAKTNPI